MTEEAHDHVEKHEKSKLSPKKENLQEFLRVQKLRSNVLQKLLDRIPIDTPVPEDEQITKTNKNQNQES
jgi:hypothetical protein